MAPKVKYRIDLVSTFDKAFASKGPAIRSKLRPLISNYDVRREIGRQAVDRIIERTRSENIDKNNKPFPGYSKGYTESLPFEIYGKGSQVDLTLTGEMLASMVVKSDSRQYVDIVMADVANNDKAHGNITGSYGRTPKKSKARDFLGLPPDEENEIVRDVVSKASSSLVDVAIGFLSEALAKGATVSTVIDNGGFE